MGTPTKGCLTFLDFTLTQSFFYPLPPIQTTHTRCFFFIKWQLELPLKDT